MWLVLRQELAGQLSKYHLEVWGVEGVEVEEVWARQTVQNSVNM